jgi:carbon storage regulator CsrA
MVTLTAAVGEEIVIDDRIRLKILAIDGDEVRFEMTFPDSTALDLNGWYGELMESN